MKHSIIILMIIVMVSGCQKIGEYYIGMNMQPDLTREDFKPGLNVYGVLKTGDYLDSLNQYFEINMVFYIKDQFDSIFVENAEIILARETAGGTKTVYQLTHIGNGVYLNSDIETSPGDSWTYRCNYDTFEVTSSCVLPNLPQIKGKAVVTSENSIRFSIQSDTSAYMYDIYLLNGEKYHFEKRVPFKRVDTEFELNPGWDVSLGINEIFIFAYDENLEKYYTTSNTFFKPNSFRPSFSTVKGGYGTFGGISSTLIQVK